MEFKFKSIFKARWFWIIFIIKVVFDITFVGKTYNALSRDPIFISGIIIGDFLVVSIVFIVLFLIISLIRKIFKK